MSKEKGVFNSGSIGVGTIKIANLISMVKITKPAIEKRVLDLKIPNKAYQLKGYTN
ncbi:MAG: hypothetical protein SGJ00_14145 [bacterium]|nr:hypothetical protein [bacterium]